MFEYVGPSKTKSMLIFKCLLLGCEGKHLACSKTTRRNLKRHIKVTILDSFLYSDLKLFTFLQNVHCKLNDAVLNKFEAACKLLDFENKDGPRKGAEPRTKQMTIHSGFQHLTQSVLDRAIVVCKTVLFFLIQFLYNIFI